MSALRVAFSGAQGRMGRVLVPAIAAEGDLEVVVEIEAGDDLADLARRARADVVVDFTTPEAALPNARAILASGAQGVIGTTGFREEDLEGLEREATAAGRGLAVVPNFSLGIVLLQRVAEEVVRHLPRVEVVEAHHENKRDAPSGTAADTARRLARAGAARGPGEAARSTGVEVEGVRVHSLRLPGLLARQEVHFGGRGETLLLRHDALDRDCYVPGVLAAIRAMPGRVGLVRGLASLLPWGADGAGAPGAARVTEDRP